MMAGINGSGGGELQDQDLDKGLAMNLTFTEVFWEHLHFYQG